MICSGGQRRIYVTDMDGTLLRSDGRLSEYSRRRLIQLLAEGVPFTVASARSVTSIRQALGDLPLELPVIAINGAFISDYRTGRHRVINDMPTDLVEHIYSRILHHKCFPFVSGHDGRRDRLYWSKLVNGGMEWYHNDRRTSGDERLTYLEELTTVIGRHPIVSLSVMGAYEAVRPLAEELQAELGDRLENHFFLNPYSPPWWWLTIHDKRSCKSRAVRTLIEQAGYSLDELVVFGDSLNDVNMFRMARTAVAVENATDEIKQYATHIIGANETDAVVDYIHADLAR